ncbi:MAG: CBS domain-containing protein [Bradyrhizobium sp.]|uniref:CBS domain-containing protein n=1 Tax=Bradyrhizobium sp. TaxID=376 RepID=UPI0029BB14F5|nr:CBS domain-containing protein [Bradyrhizobium sp.]MDX3966903.1 CBS domain-containing protein [Bradyrhizobium sp.]
MTTNVISVGPDTDVRTVARRLIERRISAVPVVDHEDRILGIVSEGDLMRRPESDTERHPSWWLPLLAMPEEKARDYLKSHGLTAKDLMSRDVVTVAEDTPLVEVATLLVRHRIKRVPVVREGKIVGIVSRANLLHGLVAREAAPAATQDDAAIRQHVIDNAKKAGIDEGYINVVVAGGIVHIWGLVDSDAEKEAVRVAAETAPGVSAVENNVGVLSSPMQRGSWA